MMIHVVTDNCIKYMDCVLPECPAEAIFPDTDTMSDPRWLELNRKFANLLPNIVATGVPPPDVDARNGVPNKLAGHFSPKPGDG